MELKHLTKIIYRIEPKPEGGFIARATDPAISTLEAPTREELQRQIQTRVFGKLAAAFPGLKLPLENMQTKFDVEIGRKPGAISTFPSDAAQSTDEAARNTKEIVDLIAKNFPEISQALAARGTDGKASNLAIKGALLPTGLTQAGAEDVRHAEATTDGNVLNAAANTPITAEVSGSWKILFFLLGLVIFAALVYFLRHH